LQVIKDVSMKYAMIVMSAVALVFLSCSKKAGYYDAAIESEADRIINAAPGQTEEKIAFFIFEISKGEPSSTIILKSAEMTPGSMSRETHFARFSDKYLSINYFQNGKLDETFKIDHPLEQHYEYSEEQGELKNVIVERDKCDFLLRFPVRSETIKVEIYEKKKDSEETKIYTTTL